MTISTAVQQSHQIDTKQVGESEAGRPETGHTPATTIPARYQDGRGGVAVARIQRDRREARRQVVRAMIRRLGALWG